MKYRHIVFDIDGTLIDTEHAVLSSMQETIKTLTGKDMPVEQLTFALGIPGEDALRTISIEDVQPALDLWINNMQKYSHTEKVFEGIPEVLDTLARSGYKMGIVTSRIREEFVHDFGRFGIGHYFETVICADDTKEHKPAPAPLLKYMELTETRSDEVLYVGDSPYDSLCAHNAGVDFALAVWGSHNSSEQAEFYPERPVDLLDIMHSSPAARNNGQIRQEK